MNNSASLRRHGFGELAHTNAQDLSFRIFGSTPDANRDSQAGPGILSPSYASAISSPFNSSMSSFQSPPTSWDTTAPKSPWSSHMAHCDSSFQTGLMGSLVRQEGHIYSLAASGDLLYTGSESKNIRVWKNQKELSAFKSKSGLVKAIVLSGDRIFSGHQDGKIRVWKVSTKDPRFYKRVGTLPTFKSRFKGSFNPSIQIQHTDAISSLCLNEEKSLLYSSSWDRTLKVWRVSDFKCLESISAHNDAVNSIVAGFDGLIFTGSADGSVKVWRRQVIQGKRTKHVLSQTLLKQECAVTALAVDPSNKFLYCGSSDGLINFWVKKGKFLSHGGVLRSHNLAVLCLAAAGNLVFSGSTDTNICVWRREGEDHYCSSVLIGHGGPVKCLAVEEEKSAAMRECGHRQYIVYSGSIDKSVKIWRVVAPVDVDGEQTQTVENYSLWQRLTTVQSFSFPTQES